jgi:hypothetical protein
MTTFGHVTLHGLWAEAAIPSLSLQSNGTAAPPALAQAQRGFGAKIATQTASSQLVNRFQPAQED